MDVALEAKINGLPGQILDNDTSTRMSINYDMLYKVIVVGDTAVGKTSLLHRLRTNNFSKDHETTIGVDNHKFEMYLEDKTHVKL